MRQRTLWIAFWCALAPAQVRPLDPAAIERVALEELKATNTPGAALAVVSGDRVVFAHGYGVASVDTGAPVSPDLLFRLGSTTKMFTATAVVGLALEGKIDLHAPVGRYISGLDDAIAKITAHQLLSHTSGLHDEAPMFGPHDETALGAGIRAWNAGFLFAEPGRIYSYSNPGFWLAGFLAESVAEKPYADVMAERVFRPLGMGRTTLRPTMAMTWPLAQGHDAIGGKPRVVRPAADNAAGWPAGSIFSNVLDLARFAIAFMNDGRLDGQLVLAPKLIALLESPHARVPGSERSYGYGLDLYTERGVHWVAHAGSRSGYGSEIRMAPQEKVAVIVTANRTGASLPKLVDAVCEAMLPLEPRSRPEQPSHALTPDEAARYVGAYANGSSRITLQADHGAVASMSGGATVRYTRAGAGFLAGEAAGDREPPRLVVVPDARGRIEFVVAGARAYRRVE